MRRSIPTLLLISAAIALTACGEYSTTEPQSGARSLGPSFAGYAVSGDDQSGAQAAATLTSIPSGTPVTFSQAGGTFKFGYFTLTYRQNSLLLCDESGTICSPATGDQQVTVKYDPNGAWIDFSVTSSGKHLGFVTPGAKLSTTAFAGQWKSLVGTHFGLLYAPTPGQPSELNAPKSHFDAGTGSLWRWVTHFSGYAVSGGDNCDPNVDPTCAPPPAM